MNAVYENNISWVNVVKFNSISSSIAIYWDLNYLARLERFEMALGIQLGVDLNQIGFKLSHPIPPN